MTDKRKTRWIIKEVRDSKGDIIKDHPWQIASVDASQPVVIYRSFESTPEFFRSHSNNITIELKIWRKPKKEPSTC